MLRALIEAGVRPDLVVGTSVGAINGAVLAACPPAEVADRLEALWRSPDAAEVFAAGAVARLRAALDGGGSFRDELGEHVTRREVRTLRSRVETLLAEPCFPEPSGYGPAIPWPAF